MNMINSIMKDEEQKFWDWFGSLTNDEQTLAMNSRGKDWVVKNKKQIQRCKK